jgi:hypothetical protein
MKYLFEFAKIRDNLSKTNSVYLKSLTHSTFKYDTTLISSVNLKKMPGKVIFIKWNEKGDHSIKDRVRTRTSFRSISEFNSFMEKTINEIFPDKINKEISESARYFIKFTSNNFCLLIDINYDTGPNNIFNKYTIIHVASLIPLSTPVDSIEILINDDYF